VRNERVMDALAGLAGLALILSLFLVGGRDALIRSYPCMDEARPWVPLSGDVALFSECDTRVGYGYARDWYDGFEDETPTGTDSMVPE